MTLLLASNTVLLFFANNVLNVNIIQACGREAECIQVYKTVEQTHPNKAVKKQAAELRYIMEAPKLQLKPEEKISLPLLENLDRYKCVCKVLYARQDVSHIVPHVCSAIIVMMVTVCCRFFANAILSQSSLMLCLM